MDEIMDLWWSHSDAEAVAWSTGHLSSARDLAIARLTRSSSTDLNLPFQDDTGTPLEWLVEAMVGDCVVMPFIEAGADPRRDVHEGRSSFAAAVWNRYLSDDIKERQSRFIDFVLELRDARTLNGWGTQLSRTGLQAASTEGDYELVRRIVEAGADPNSRENVDFWVNWTPLALAVEANRPDVALVLLEAGAEWDFTAGNASPASLVLKQLTPEARDAFLASLPPRHAP